MTNQTNEPAEAGTQSASAETAALPAPSQPTPTIRHDGWNGEKIAIFCETLAETAIVADACEAAHMSISGAYAARRRNPIFAAAWDAALTIARERLADTLLARSMEGNIEQVWRDGELVGERHVIDNRLGLAILRRLDRLAEGGVCVSARDLPFSGQCRSPTLRRESFNWEHAMHALRTGDNEGVARALALIEGDKVEEVEALRDGHAEPEEIDLSDRCWFDHSERRWMTDFPPPAGFTGYQSCDWGDPDEVYKRECTPQEVALLEADSAAARAAERAEEEALRDQWFSMLKEEQGLDAAERDAQPAQD